MSQGYCFLLCAADTDRAGAQDVFATSRIFGGLSDSAWWTSPESVAVFDVHYEQNLSLHCHNIFLNADS